VHTPFEQVWHAASHPLTSQLPVLGLQVAVWQAPLAEQVTAVQLEVLVLGWQL
jgi:hypothetical protein